MPLLVKNVEEESIARNRGAVGRVQIRGEGKVLKESRSQHYRRGGGHV